MKLDQNIVRMHHSSAIPLSQIRSFHAKAHCLRSRAMGDFVNKLVVFFTNLPKRFSDYRNTLKLYNELCTMDRRQLRDLGLTRNDIERIKLGQAGLLSIQQEQADLTVKSTSPKQADMACDQEVSLPKAVAQ